MKEKVPDISFAVIYRRVGALDAFHHSKKPCLVNAYIWQVINDVIKMEKQK
jgi:hypothetical protein